MATFREQHSYSYDKISISPKFPKTNLAVKNDQEPVQQCSDLSNAKKSMI